MIFNYIITAFRNLKKRRLYTLVNILGLSVGLTCFLLLFAFTEFEESYDNFHANKSRIYRVIFEQRKGDELVTRAPQSQSALGYQIDEIPGVEMVTRYSYNMEVSIIKKNAETIIKERDLIYVDTDFFKIFSFELISGNKETVLQDPLATVITESIAKKLFANTNPVGQTLEISNEFGLHTYTITGIAKDPPLNTSHDFKILCNIEAIKLLKKDHETNWHGPRHPTYIQIGKQNSIDQVAQKIPNFIKKYKPNSTFDKEFTWNYSFQPLEKIHLESNFFGGDSPLNLAQIIMNILKLLGFLILIISWVN